MFAALGYKNWPRLELHHPTELSNSYRGGTLPKGATGESCPIRGPPARRSWASDRCTADLGLASQTRSLSDSHVQFRTLAAVRDVDTDIAIVASVDIADQCRVDNRCVSLDFAGAAIDVAVSDLDRAARFYTVLMGRSCDLRPRADQQEWRLYPRPEVVLRLTALADAAGKSTAAIGVRDLALEHARLASDWVDLPVIQRQPGVIAVLRLADPDGNTVILWQDLMGEHR